MAQVAEEIEDTIDFKFKNSLDTVSKGATHLRLMYHQCIILATRPLLLCLLQDRLKPRGSDDNCQLSILRSVQDLVQTCVESATKTLRMLAALSRNNMLDSFLPFDLDFACSAASILILVKDILDCVKVDPSAQRLIDKILDEMILAGNNAAVLRRKEIQQLRSLGSRMRTKTRPQGMMTATSSTDTNSSTAVARPTPPVPRSSFTSINHIAPPMLTDSPTATASETAVMYSTAQPLSPIAALSNPFTPVNPKASTNADLNDETMTQVSSGTGGAHDLAQNFDLSYEQMLSVADQLDVNAFSSNMDFNEFGRLDWLDLGF